MIRSQDGAAEEVAVHGDGGTCLLKKKMSNGGILTWFINTPNDTAWAAPADYAVLKQIIKNALRLSLQAPDGGTRGLTFDGTHLWSVDSGEGTSLSGEAYYKVDPATGEVVEGWLRPPPEVNGPLGITFDGTSIWSSTGDGDQMIYQHDPVDLIVLDSFSSPRTNLADLAWDGNNLWAAVSNSGVIIRIDPATGAETGAIPLPPSVSQPAGLTYALGCFYLGDDGSDAIYKLDSSTGEVLDSWAAPGSYPAGLAFDGAYLWVSDGTANRIYRVLKVEPCSDLLDCSDCHPDASCIDTGIITCECNSGYSGDGFVCTDIDECADEVDDCASNAACANVAGSFNCECNSGFAGDGTTCTDIDECSDGTDNCHQDAICTNTAGGFECSCPAGYTGDGVTCTPEEEESDTSDGCSCSTRSASNSVVLFMFVLLGYLLRRPKPNPKGKPIDS
ncbi:EGF domain-containing protein [Myxococcota bacterium]